MNDRRAYPRFLVEGLRTTLGLGHHASVQNISVGGVALELDRGLKAGAEYSVRLEIEDRAMGVRGVVARCVLNEIRKDTHMPVYSAGIRFSDVMDERIVELLGFIGEFKMAGDQRTGPRVEIDIPSLVILDPPRRCRARTISSSGVLIASEEALAVDTVCGMEVSIQDGNPVRFFGKVAWCARTQQQAGLYDIGVAFVQLPPEDNKRLGHFIKAQKIPPR